MKFIYTYENINSVEIIRVFTRFGKQLAFLDMSTKTLYNTSANFKLFYEIANNFAFMITGIHYLPTCNV